MSLLKCCIHYRSSKTHYSLQTNTFPNATYMRPSISSLINLIFQFTLGGGATNPSVWAAEGTLVEVTDITVTRK
jgi:hypothetical protein